MTFKEMMNNSTKEYLVDVAVVIMIFARPEKLAIVFERIKEIRPKKIFIISDGARENFPNDISLIEKSRKIVDEIDWNCEIYKKYNDKNKGMYKTLIEGFNWAFSFVESFIFIEDDIVPSLSFFNFTKELLDKFSDDERIHMICGMNHNGIYKNVTSDYFFSRKGSIWGFALWKRTYDSFDYSLSFSEDPHILNLLLLNYPRWRRKKIKKDIKFYRDKWLKDKIKSVPFELISSITQFLNNQTLIVSTKNQISCIGISENSGHSVNHLKKLPKSIRRLFYMKAYEVKQPIKHAKFIMNDLEYEKIINKYNTLFFYLRNKIETKLRVIFFNFFN